MIVSAAVMTAEQVGKNRIWRQVENKTLEIWNTHVKRII